MHIMSGMSKEEKELLREAERMVLAHMLLDDGALADGCGALDAADFIDRRDRTIYLALRDMRAKGEAVDTVTLGYRLERDGRLQEAGGHTYLLGIADKTFAIPCWTQYLRIMKEGTVRRMVARLAEKATAYLDAGTDSGTVVRDISRMTAGIVARQAEIELEFPLRAASVADNAPSAA